MKVAKQVRGVLVARNANGTPVRVEFVQRRLNKEQKSEVSYWHSGVKYTLGGKPNG